MMRPSEALPKHRETIRQLVLEAGMANPRVFGSVLHGEDKDGSDLDILIDPAPRTSLLDLAGLQIEIESRIGFKVDLLTPKCLPLKSRQRVLDEAQPV
jgi:predicted nucleotidyltransferase